ncbi:MAG TPA: hypothetical protein VGL20_11315 [Candidatus Dormibacteraeota bacterium]
MGFGVGVAVGAGVGVGRGVGVGVGVGCGVAVGVGPPLGGGGSCGVGQAVGATVADAVAGRDRPCPPGGEATGTGRSGFLGNGVKLDEAVGATTMGPAVWAEGWALWSTVGVGE